MLKILFIIKIHIFHEKEVLITLKILFLGTGAADWNINNRNENEEFRRFSSALIEDNLLIDPGPHIFDYAEKNNCPNIFDNVKNIIVTHSHYDHFCSQSVKRLCAKTGCKLWGDNADMRKLMRDLSPDSYESIPFYPLEIKSTFAISENCSVIPLRANHATDDKDETCLNYIIEYNGKRIFYGLDSGWIMYENWLVMQKYKFDALIFEATIGDVEGDNRVFGHNNLKMVEIMTQTFRTQNILNDNAKIIVSHMARTLHTPHAQLVKRLEPLNIIPAFDGMEIEI